MCSPPRYGPFCWRVAHGNFPRSDRYAPELPLTVNLPSDRLMATPAAPAPFELDLRQMLRTLWRRRWLILLCGALLAGSAWFYVGRIEPVYTATSSVMLDSRRQRIVDVREILSQMAPLQVTVLSEVEVLRSRGLAERVAIKLDLFSDPEFDRSLRPPEPPGMFDFVGDAYAAALRMVFPPPPRVEVDPETREARRRAAVINAVGGRLTAAAVPQSLVIRISYTSNDPRKAARIANAFAEAYVNDQLEARFDALRRGSAWLNERLETLRQSVVASESAVAAYRSSIGLIETRGGGQINNQRLQEVSSQVVLVQARRAEQEARVSRLEALLRENRGVDAADEVLDSPLLQRLKEQEAQLARENAELRLRYGANHPAMTRSNAELGSARTTITAEVRKQAQAMRSELTVLREREGTLTRQSRDLEALVLRQSGAEVRLRELEREAQANRTLYESFLARFKETGDQEGIQQSDSRVISQAREPRVPSAPRARLIVVGALLAGLAIGIALALVVERFDDAFRSKDELESTVGYPVVGMIPHIATLPGRRVENQIVDKPTSGYAEAFRMAWFGLRHAAKKTEIGLILVTSSVPEEGKSLTSLSLARTSAGLSKRTLLIDADLRRSTVAKMLEIKPPSGLADALVGTVRWTDAVVRDPMTEVDVLVARGAGGANADMPTVAQELGRIVAEAKAAYDVVVVDCPPTMPVADAQVVAPLADATLFCVRWNATPRAAVRESLRTLATAGAPISGLLLTRVNVRRHAAYGYGDVGHYYGKYRGYYGK